ncbi:NAD(P)/FAD-dependent oxidoreductase [Hanstruepera flava]|uniref:NAD(P)/FAD-dependent oxidoreductase n=1 Tax=Hanstruepera flava TaxID=2930218 RepID=UPI002027AB38|nr:FAD-binding oxidoreductase [Hanstruepera flava]
MNVDYIIVGCGLAGISFAETLRKANRSFVVIDNASQRSSLVAAGMYNPVILKRFSEVWKAQEQLQIALPFYKELEVLLNKKIDYKLSVLRRFASIEEQNMWFHATDNPVLEPFLSDLLVQNNNLCIDAPYGFGKVLNAGRIDTDVLLKQYVDYLKKQNLFFEETFSYAELNSDNGIISYKGITAKHIVFCEGFGLKANPYFNDLPLNGTKGELITIQAPDLKIDFSLKASVFLIPEEEDIYSVGATYNWEDKTNTPTHKAREELVTKVKTFLKCNFEVVGQKAGIRPTVKDRRPLVGTHKKYKNIHVLNGLGTRGVMIGPYVAKQLYNNIEEGVSLNPEIDISRFIS